MKKLILVLVVFILLSLKGGEYKVFKCDSANAKRYHLTETCRGLNACKHKIIKITLNKAKGQGLTLCKWEG